jgi:hypothetical protein
LTKVVAFALVCALCVEMINADCYMHHPRGANNRLDEPNRDRNNGNRVWDSQNNNRGGSNVGSFGRPYYYEGSIMAIEWTVQHSCGDPHNKCEMILQYYCDNNITRDGLSTTTIPDQPMGTNQCLGGDCDTDTTYGRHESWQWYQDCKSRERNHGLFTSTQQLQGNGAIFTRQNAAGTRHGYECPEERDYYPYWHPTQWIDVAIFTNDVTRCPAYIAASENVSPRSYCVPPTSYVSTAIANTGNADGIVPITPEGCQNILGQWVTVPPNGQPAPNCSATMWSRDNELGNGDNLSGVPGFPVGFNWTIPYGYANTSCIFRIRYNISTAETEDNDASWASPESVANGYLNSTYNYTQYQLPKNILADGTEYAYEYPAKVPVWEKYGLTYNDVLPNFEPTLFAQTTPQGISTRGYVMQENPIVDIFGSLLSTQGAIRLQLAMDTSQFGRTFQDRSHVFTILPRPSILGTSNVWNLAVRGKRGNIVQTFPGTEYDFTFDSLHLNQGDFIHFQWTGSNTNPNNNAGQGTQGTDRSNLVLLRSNPVTQVASANLNAPFPGTTGSWKQSYPERLDTDTVFMGLNYAQRNALANVGLYTPVVDIGPLQVTEPGIFNYISTRNHAFTNRDQKAQVVVAATPGFTPNAAFNQANQVSPFTQMSTPDGQAWVRYYPDPTALTTGSQLWLTTDDLGRVVINPPLIDVVPGQQLMLDMRYDNGQNIAVHQPFILQSDFTDFSYYTSLPTSYNGGIASASITRGGYYICDVRANIGAVVGITIGCVALVGGAAFVYLQVRKRFAYGQKKTELIGGGETTSTSV